MLQAARNIITAGLLVGFVFIVGWLAGLHGEKVWTTVKGATVESYLNRYRVMSDSGLSSIVYYVSTKQSAPLLKLAASSDNIIEVTATRIDNLYDVKMSYSSRVATVKQLRALASVDTVITLPLICH